MVEEAQVAFPHLLHDTASLWVAHAAPWFGFCAGSEVVDGEGFTGFGAVFIALVGLGFKEPVYFLIAIGVAVRGRGDARCQGGFGRFRAGFRSRLGL